MIGVTAKIGEFFTSLILALFTAGAKVLVIGIVLLALVIAMLLGLQYLFGRATNSSDKDKP